MSELTQKDHYGPLDKIYYNDIDFKMAFSVEGFWDKERKDDEQYVKWMARHIFAMHDGVRKENLLDIHSCTEADLKEFYPVSS